VVAKKDSSRNPKSSTHKIIEDPVSSIELPRSRHIDMFSQSPAVICCNSIFVLIEIEGLRPIHILILNYFYIEEKE